jgi:hypothetical protein
MAACSSGGASSAPDSGASGPDARDDAARDVASADTEAGRGWTRCSAPSGAAVCGGPAQCPVDGVCQTCLFPDPKLVEACVTAVTGSGLQCSSPPDGDICYSVADSSNTMFWLSASYDLGVLFAENGGTSRVRYGDCGLWTGDPLPTPSTCPTEAGFQLCGPACPGCAAGRVCTGRSPLHPWGICGQDYRCGTGYGGCPGGQLCFVYSVQPSAQTVADAYGMCLPSGECQAAAAKYPGGAKCL